MKKNLILGLGNSILSDDAIGLFVVRRAQELLAELKEYVDFKENHSGGFDLLYDINGYDRLLVVDSIVTGKNKPGTCLTFTIKDFEYLLQLNPVNSHSLNLPTTIKTGKKCGYKMPEDFIILGIESADVTTLSEQLTASVNGCVDNVVERIRKEIHSWIELDSSVH